MCAGVFSVLGFSGEKVNPVGKKAPELKAVDQNNQSIDLGEIYKKGLVLIYFYPKANTPGCTAQACSLRDAFEELTESGLTIIGVSTDSPSAQKRFESDHHLPFTLIADEDKAVTKAFGVPTTFGFAKRQAFLIKDGTIIWFDGSASTGKQADDIKKVLSEL
jgi:peroxiredoxin Q/BCP